jgi:FAD/FMN-containing dehydrogenase
MAGGFAEGFRAAVGDGAVVTDRDRLAAYEVDGIVPDVVLAPGTIDEAISTLHLASEEKVRVLFRGSGTKLGFGFPLEECPAVLSTERMQDVVDFDGKNFTVTVQAGMPLDALQSYLASENMFFPLDPPYPCSTVGGNIACKTSGPGRLMYGALRDMLLGVRAVLASGEVVQFGGMVMKNVAGFDMSKFFVGTLGTIGLVVEATLKLHAMPERRETVAAWFDTPAGALQVSHAVIGSYLEPSRIMMLDAGGYGLVAGEAAPSGSGVTYLLVGFEGVEEAVRREVRDGLDLCRQMGGREATSLSEEVLWERIRELHQQFAEADRDGVVCRISVPLAGLESTFVGLETLFGVGGPPAAIACDSGCGMVYCLLLGAEASEQVGTIDSLSRLASANDGFFRIEVAPTVVRRRAAYLSPTAPTTAIMQRLQRRFDPQGILHPEKLFGHE